MEEIKETSIEYDTAIANIQLSPAINYEKSITFHVDGKEMLRISPTGIFFHGDRVDDKLKMYDRFNEWLTRAGYPPPKPTRRKRRKPTNPY